MHPPSWRQLGIAFICLVIYCFLLAVLQDSWDDRRVESVHRPAVDRVSYASSQVIRFSHLTPATRQQLLDDATSARLDIWRVAKDAVDVRLDTEQRRVLESPFATITSSVLMDNVEAFAHQQLNSFDSSTLMNGRGEVVFRKVSDTHGASFDAFFDSYPSSEAIRNFLDQLSTTYPDLMRNISSIGTTYESRSIDAIHLSTHPEKSDRPTLLLIGGQHAREWVSITSTLYIVHELVTKFNEGDRAAKRFFDRFDLRVIPVANPDGYAYSRDVDRMWRKNRQPTGVDGCIGVDVNRNFPTFWTGKLHSHSTASTTDACYDGRCRLITLDAFFCFTWLCLTDSIDYPGLAPLEAVEAAALINYVHSIPKLVASIDLHSYSQYWMYPYAADCTQKPGHWEDLVEAALGAAAAARNHPDGARYGVGAACDLLPRASGSLMDWMYVERSVKYSYYVELRDTGAWGFLLPPSEIRSTGEDALGGVLFLAEFIRERERV